MVESLSFGGPFIFPPPPKLRLVMPRSQPQATELDSGTVQRLCAGQVITTLSGAVKELLDNALDAGAQHIDVHLAHYGLERVSVSDDGRGIPSASFEVLCRRHWTSKLRTLAELSEGIRTLGFRGEALNALCRISGDFQVVTRTAAAPVAHRLAYTAEGELASAMAAVRRVGTTVTATTLFATVPVRRQHLRRHLRAAYARTVRLVQGYALLSNKCTIALFVTTRAMPQPGPISAESSHRRGSRRPAVPQWTLVFRTLPAAPPLPPGPDPDFVPDSDPTAESSSNSGPGMDYSPLLRFLQGAATAVLGSACSRQLLPWCTGRPDELAGVRALPPLIVPAYGGGSGPARSPTQPRAQTPSRAQESYASRLVGLVSPCLRTQRPYTSGFGNSDDVTGVSGSGSRGGSGGGGGGGGGALGSTGTAARFGGQGASRHFFAVNFRPAKLAGLSRLLNGVYRRFASPAVAGVRSPVVLLHILLPAWVVDANLVPDKQVLGILHHEALTQHIADSLAQLYERVQRQFATPAAGALTEGPDLVTILGSSPVPPRREPSASPRPTTSGEGGSAAEDPPAASGTATGVSPNTPAAPQPLPRSEIRSSKLLTRHSAVSSATWHPAQWVSGPVAAGQDMATPSPKPATPSDLTTVSAMSATPPRPGEPTVGTMGSDLQTASSPHLAPDSSGPGRPGPTDPCSDDQHPSSGSSVVAQRPSSPPHIERFTTDPDPGPDSDLRHQPPPATSPPVTLPMVQWGHFVRAADADHAWTRARARGGSLAVPLARLSSGSCSDSSSGLVWSWNPRSSGGPARASPDSGVFCADPYSASRTVLERELSIALTKASFTRMKVIGQFNLSFILVNHGDEIFIVDQHAADEKARFERLEALGRPVTHQRLLVPRPLELSPEETLIVRDHAAIFAQNGFSVREVRPPGPGPSTAAGPPTAAPRPASQHGRLELTTIPAQGSWQFGIADLQELIQQVRDRPEAAQQVCSDIAGGSRPTSSGSPAGGGGRAVMAVTPDPLSSVRPRFRLARIRHMHASRACRSAIMMGDPLTYHQMVGIIGRLARLHQPWACPHGRPTIRFMVRLEPTVQLPTESPPPSQPTPHPPSSPATTGSTGSN